MVIRPIDSQKDEAQQVSKKRRHHRAQRLPVRPLRTFELQDHDRYQDGDDPVTKSFQPPFAHHPLPCDTFAELPEVRRISMLSRIGRILTATVILSLPAFAQQRAYTAADYERAGKLMGYNTNPLVLHSGVRPTWLAGEKFWYRVSTEKGTEFLLVDPVKGGKEPAFDHAKLASALSKADGNTYTAYNLPFQTFDIS